MINIEIVGSPYKKIILEGHAGSAEKGKDLVCAAISAIVTGTINSLDEIVSQNQKYILKEGYSEIYFADDEKSQLIAEVMIIQLKTIENSYPKYVKIKYSQSEV